MASVVVASGASASMDDLPLWIQPTGGDPDLNYTGASDRTVFDALFAAEGVMGTASWKLTQRGAGANFSVDVAAGAGVITGDSIANQGKYLARSVGTVNVAYAGGAPASGTRIHRIIARIRDKSAAGTDYDWTFEWLEDTGTGTPALPASALHLGLVSIASGQASVTNANITDGRTQAWPYTADVFVRKTADQSVTSSITLVDDTHLQVPVAANAVYAVRTWLLYVAGSTGKLKLGWSGPTSATLDWNVGALATTAVVASSDFWFGSNTIGGTDLAGGLGAGTPLVAQPTGTLVTSTTAGLLKFRFAQSASDATATTIKQNSWLLMTRVA